MKSFWKNIFLITPFIIQFFYVFQGILISPFATGDAYAIWFFKAKVLYLSGFSGFQDFLLNPKYVYTHPGYPILLPVIFAGIYVLTGGAREIFLLAIYPIIYLSIILSLYLILKKEIGKSYAYLASFFWATTPIIERHAGQLEIGFADLPLSLFILIGTVCAYKFFKKPILFSFLVTILSLGFAANIKFEGLLWIFSLLTASIYLVIKSQNQSGFRLTMVAGTALLFIIPWFWFLLSNNIALDYVTSSGKLFQVSAGSRLIKIIFYFPKELFKIGRWGLTGLALFSLIGLFWQKIWFSSLKPILLALIIQFILYMGVYLISPIELIGHLDVSLYRLIIQFLPLWIWLIFSANKIFFQNNKGK